MKHALLRSSCVLAMTLMALSTPSRATPTAVMDTCMVGCWWGSCIDGVALCYSICQNSHGGACGGSCEGSGQILYCSGDPM